MGNDCCGKKDPGLRQKTSFNLPLIGNSSKRYQSTRHNAGHLFLDYLCRRLDIQESTDLHDYKVYQHDTFYAIKPNQAMNRNGRGLKHFMQHQNPVDIKRQLIVVCDNLEGKLGAVAYKESGSAKGHNGVKDIMKVLGGDAEFARILIGIDRPESKDPEVVGNWVLGKFTQRQLDVLQNESFPQAYDLLMKRMKMVRSL